MTIVPASRFLLIACIALSALLAGPGADFRFGPAPAFAQEAQNREGGGLLRYLFGRRDQPQRVQEAPRQPAPQQRQRQRPRQAGAAPRQSAPAAPAPVAIDKSEDAAKVLLVGDFLAGGLADGLQEAYADNPDVMIVGRANGSSGLVRDDHFDWPGRIGEILDAVEPAVVVVMIGSNDRQQMRVGGQNVQPRSEPWLAEYERRAKSLAAAVRSRDLPLLWVGTVPFRPGNMTSDMLAFNDIYRRVLTETGGEFVDVWDGFVDENGAFVANGPDMNGQPAQLRAGDGINVTRAGRRKIAFYVEKPLERLLGDGMQQGPPGVAQEPMGPAIPDDDITLIERTVPVSLTAPDLDGGSELLGGTRGREESEARTIGEKLVREGIAPASRAGRADDFGLGISTPPRRPATTTTSSLPENDGEAADDDAAR